MSSILGLFGPLNRPSKPLTLPKLDHLDLDRSIYTPALENDFLNIPVDRDLTAWRKHDISYTTNTDDDSRKWQDFVVYNDNGGTISMKCALPEGSDYEQMAVIPDEEEKKRMIEAALQVVSNLSSNGCIRHREGWWTYEVCHMKRIRQYHVVTATDHAELVKSKSRKTIPKVGSISSEYLLGRYLPGHAGSTDIKFGNVFTMTYRDGDTCHTADRGYVSRITEVRFVCSNGNNNDQPRLTPHFIDVFERQICNYVIIIGVPSLCTIPAFQPWSRPKQTIYCQTNESPVDPTTETKTKPSEPEQTAIRFDKLHELIDSSSDTFPLLRRAIMDLLQSEFSAQLPDSFLNSHLPRKSLFEVFSELSAEATSEANASGEVNVADGDRKDKRDKNKEQSESRENEFQFKFEI